MKNQGPISTTATQIIPLEKIMLPKHQALSNAWGNAKQSLWGKLSAYAILISSDKIKHNELNSAIEIYRFIAQCRRLIGTILNHSTEVGKPRSGYLQTIFSNQNRYKDQYPELKRILETTTNGPCIQVKNDNGTKSFTFSSKDGEKEYERTVMSLDFMCDEIMMYHTKEPGFLIKKADEAFNELKSSADLDRKKILIAQIFHCFNDAVLTNRGGAAISQIAYHALEFAFIEKFSYFGKIASKFGYTCGVQADIASMVSPTFEDFYTYLNTYIIEPAVEVSTQTTLVAPMESQKFDIENRVKEFRGNIKLFLEDIAAFEKLFADDDIGVLTKHRKQQLEGFKESLLFLDTFEKSCISKNNELTYATLFLFDELVNAFVNNDLIYPYFYASLKQKQYNWPARALATYEDIQDKNKYLAQFGSFFAKMEYAFCSPLAGMYPESAETPHEVSRYICKTLWQYAMRFENNTTEPLSHFFCAIKHRLTTDDVAIKFKSALNDFIDLLAAFHQHKQSISWASLTSWMSYTHWSKKAYINSVLVDQSKKFSNAPNFLRQFKNMPGYFTEIYDKIDILKEQLITLQPIMQILDLKNPNFDKLIGSNSLANKANDNSSSRINKPAW
ncbi:MAG: hypothetical protein JSS07_02020 [Proteobacteria bacterium]|nr:hypothetical protein [Pseudomonadota bacterium]